MQASWIGVIENRVFVTILQHIWRESADITKINQDYETKNVCLVFHVNNLINETSKNISLISNYEFSMGQCLD